MQPRHEGFVVLHRAGPRRHGAAVADVGTVVDARTRTLRARPHDVDSERRVVVELGQNTRHVADALAVRAHEGARLDLVRDRLLPPLCGPPASASACASNRPARPATAKPARALAVRRRGVTAVRHCHRRGVLGDGIDAHSMVPPRRRQRVAESPMATLSCKPAWLAPDSSTPNTSTGQAVDDAWRNPPCDVRADRRKTSRPSANACGRSARRIGAKGPDPKSSVIPVAPVVLVAFPV